MAKASASSRDPSAGGDSFREVGVLRIVLGVMRGAGTVGAVAADRLAAGAPDARSAQPLPVPAERDAAFNGLYPSQSEGAAALDTYIGSRDL